MEQGSRNGLVTENGPEQNKLSSSCGATCQNCRAIQLSRANNGCCIPPPPPLESSAETTGELTPIAIADEDSVSKMAPEMLVEFLWLGSAFSWPPTAL